MMRGGEQVRLCRHRQIHVCIHQSVRYITSMHPPSVVVAQRVTQTVQNCTNKKKMILYHQKAEWRQKERQMHRRDVHMPLWCWLIRPPVLSMSIYIDLLGIAIELHIYTCTYIESEYFPSSFVHLLYQEQQLPPSVQSANPLCSFLSLNRPASPICFESIAQPQSRYIQLPDRAKERGIYSTAFRS